MNYFVFQWRAADCTISLWSSPLDWALVLQIPVFHWVIGKAEENSSIPTSLLKRLWTPCNGWMTCCDDNTVVEGGSRDDGFKCFFYGTRNRGTDHEHRLLVMCRSTLKDGKFPDREYFIIWITNWHWQCSTWREQCVSVSSLLHTSGDILLLRHQEKPLLSPPFNISNKVKDKIHN